jgi:methionyl-tRNA formyltransferase
MKTYVIGTLDFGKDVIDSLLDSGVDVSGVIGLSNREKSDSISGYNYLKPFSEERGINFFEVSSYTLREKEDIELIKNLDIDYLIVVGWQRLIPSWLIAHTNKLAIGCHGSPFGITKGRGRSPQNWSLILGCKEFYISIFQIDEGTDSGPVISTRKFEYTQHDDIRTSYYKVGLLTAEMITDFFSSGCDVSQIECQDETIAEYLPQRLPEDGYIDWDRTAAEISRFVGALTSPYPGALTKIDGRKFKVLRAFPFHLVLYKKFIAGTVVKVFNNSDILVSVRDGFILVTALEPLDSNSLPLEGDIFESINFKEQMSVINKRHNDKYPHLPLSSLVLSQGI